MKLINLKYSEILMANNDFAKSLKEPHYNIKILSNIMLPQLSQIIECSLRFEGISAIASLGDYDNLVQDSFKCKKWNAAIIFIELSNVIDGLHYKAELLNEKELKEIINKIKLEIGIVLKNLEDVSLVLINKFTSRTFSTYSIKENNLDELAYKLNLYLGNGLPSNVKLIDIESILVSVGLWKSLDLRYYYSSKALYTVDYLKAYTEHIKPYFMSANGKSKKALIFDCDNTLWKGILGEDGFNNVQMSTATKDGAIFSEIQSMALAINKQGILIGLCSKNNPADVDEVIESHPDMQLRDEHITINKSNWSDKVSNLKEIAQELNIGLESLVFIDDSNFEVNLIKEQLPEVTVLQVPVILYEYPKLLRENICLFYNLSFTEEDKKKVEMYKQQANRETIKKEFTNIEDYLISLDLKITIHLDDQSIIPRISQMSQKTNQFNLTTKRYTEAEIKSFIENSTYEVYAISISDKFGDSGVTGLCIINFDDKNKTADINTFLISCRIIGRNIEYAFINYIIEKIKGEKTNVLKAKYIKTSKNEQVINFYEDCTFSLINYNTEEKNYLLETNRYSTKNINYIEIIDE